MAGTFVSVLNDLLRPRSLVSHVLVLTVAAVCIWLGLWQLDRLEQVRTHNELLESRLRADPIDLAPLVRADGEDAVDEVAFEYRRVTLTGTYRPEDEVLQRGQSHQNNQGFHLLTPFDVADGGVVLVRRGWVPVQFSEPPVTEAAPPTGQVTLRGVLERPVGQPSGWLAPHDPDEGHLARVFHTDTSRLDAQIDGELFPMVLRAEEPIAAPDAPLPIGVGSPELDGGNHLSYALQWFSFALLAVVTYGAWFRTRRRRSRHDGTDPSDARSIGQRAPTA